MIFSGSLVQRNGPELPLVSSPKQSIASWSATSEWKTPPFQAPLGQFSEETFGGVEPGGRRRGEVEDEAWVPPSHFLILGCLWAA